MLSFDQFLTVICETADAGLAANRRKSFCARMGGMEGSMKKPNGEPSRKALALRKWNC